MPRGGAERNRPPAAYMPQHLAAVLLAPLFPLVCLALVLWLDHLEETLAEEPAKSLPDEASPTPQESPIASAAAIPDRPTTGLEPAVAD